jgi:hypothetical protein
MSWLNEDAYSNMPPMCVTEPTSHPEVSWLNADGESIQGWEIRSENLPAGRRIYAQRNHPSPPLQLTLLINTVQ